MHQGLTGRPRQEGSYYAGVGDVRELVALPGEAPDVPMEGLTGLLTVVLEVPWVPRALVRALEVSQRSPSDPPNSRLCWMAGVPTTLVPNWPRIVEGCG